MRRWSELSQVERVDVYTRQSLYVVLWLFVGLLFLSGASRDDHGGRASLVLAGVATVVLTAAASLVLHDVIELHPRSGPLPWRSIIPLLLLSAAAVGIALPQADAVRGALVTVVVVDLGLALGGLRDPRVPAVLVPGLAALMGATAGELVGLASGVVMTVFLIFTARASLWLVGVVTELDEARTAQSALAVAEERLRFSRDVHDVMGRRLSAIAMQSELAASLARRGDQGAADRMLAVREVAHEALREARELARGYRPVDLDQELDGARALLRSAGIDVRLDVDDVPATWQEPAAWVVREAVTNVLRHSDASMVEIAFRAPELVVTNDGVSAAGSGTGSGIDGLRERLAPRGATLAAAVVEDRFVLTARFVVPEESA